MTETQETQKLKKPRKLPSIPIKLMQDKRVNAGAKILYLYLVVFTKKQGYCNAPNDDLAKIVGVSTSTIARQLACLRDSEWISIRTKNVPYLSKTGKLRWKTQRILEVNNDRT